MATAIGQVRYARKVYRSKSGLRKALARLGDSVVHYFECGQGTIVCWRVS